MASAAFDQVLAAGRTRFIAGQAALAHDAWELGAELVEGDERDVLQALALWAAAIEHHQQGKGQGGHRLLLRAMERVGEVRDDFDGLDVELLREALLASLESTEQPYTVMPPWPEGDPAGPEEVSLEHQTQCPYCGEAVLVAVAPEDSGGARYVEDCPVCCRPWQVEVRGGRVSIDRDDAQD
jgi:hypothetical protein